MEIIIETIFWDLLLKMFQVTEDPPVQECHSAVSLEENIIWYVCGYNGMKLCSKYLKMQGDRAAEFVEYLDKLHADDQQAETALFLKYTAGWMCLINRGRLYQASDSANWEIELPLQHRLSQYIKASAAISFVEAVGKKEMVIESVCQNTRIYKTRYNVSSIPGSFSRTLAFSTNAFTEIYCLTHELKI